jgi:predicted N-acetyltransferase YhbS
MRRHAWRNRQASVSRTSVVCDRGSGAIAGHGALSAGQIERGVLPKPAQRNRPDPMPVLLLAQLAVDPRHPGRGVARSLLLFSLPTAVGFARGIGF